MSLTSTERADAMVLAPWVPLRNAPHLPEIVIDLVVDGEVVSTGIGEAVLGDPARAVAWLANALGAFGMALEAGHLVMPGSCTAAPFVGAGDHVEARFADLGTVTATFT